MTVGHCRATQLDEHTFGIYLSVPAKKVVLLQSLFELYEGVGTVRTIEVSRSLACVLTTKELLPTCLQILKEIQELVRWQEEDPPEDSEAWIGFRRRRTNMPEADG